MTRAGTTAAALERRRTRPAFPARALLAILLVAFNLRIAVATVGPLIERIRADTGMSSAVAGLLTAIPFLCMGIFAVAGIELVRRGGFSRLLVGSVALIAAGTALRAWMESSALLVLTTIPIGVGIALAGVSLQGVVKATFATRFGAVSGEQVAALALGAGIGALTVLPAADALSWHAALALTALPACVAVAVWPWLARSLGNESAHAMRSAARAPSRTALVLGLMFGCQGMCFAAMIACVAAIYEDAGWSPGDAALATASIPLLTIPAALVLPALSDRGDRPRWVAGTALALILGLIGIAAAPNAAAWLWLALFGLGVGAIFALILALALDCAEDPLESFDLSAWMLAIGFSMSAAGPVLIGGLRDLTGGFETGVGVLAALAAGAAVLALAAPPPHQPPLRKTLL